MSKITTDSIMNIDNKIFSKEEKQHIINQFPDSLHELLNNVNNPLDQTEVILNLVKDKDIKIIFKISENNNIEKEPLFCGVDIAKLIKYSDTNVYKWKKWLETDEYVTYGSLKSESYKLYDSDYGITIWENEKSSHKNEANFNNSHDSIIKYEFCFDKTKTNLHNDTIFLTLEGLKNVLINVDVEGAKEYKLWINKIAKIMSDIIKYIHKIKQQYEITKRDDEILNYKNIISNLENKNKELEIYKPKEKIPNAAYLYIWGRDEKEGIYKCGQTKFINKRQEDLGRGDKKASFLYYAEIYEDHDKYEKIIHSFLSKYRCTERQEWFSVDFNICKNIIGSISQLSNFIYENLDNIGHYNLLENTNKMINEIKINNDIMISYQQPKLEPESFINPIINAQINKETKSSNPKIDAHISSPQIDTYIMNPNKDTQLMNLESEISNSSINKVELVGMSADSSYQITKINIKREQDNIPLFINEMCALHDDLYCEKKTLEHAFMFWCHDGASADNKKLFYNFFENNFKVISVYDDKIQQKISCYKGIRPVKLEYNNENQHYDGFINDECVVGYNYCIPFDELSDKYNRWRKNKDANYEYTNPEKTAFRNYLKERFYYSDACGRGENYNKRGFYGIGISEDDMRMNLSGKSSKTILKKNIETGIILGRWNSLTSCSMDHSIDKNKMKNSSGISQNAIYNSKNEIKKIYCDNYYFMYENYVETKRASRRVNK